MKKYLQEFIKKLEKEIAENHKFTSKEIELIREKINDFQHERLIHLLVTLFYVIFTLTFMGFGMISPIFLIPFFIGIIFLIFYIKHYFFLENGVQYIYKLYDKITNYNSL